jgi:hypothetical protein
MENELVRRQRITPGGGDDATAEMMEAVHISTPTDT